MFLDELRNKALNDDKLAEANKEIDQLESELKELRASAYNIHSDYIYRVIKAHIEKEVEDGHYTKLGDKNTVSSKIIFRNSTYEGSDGPRLYYGQKLYFGEKLYNRIIAANENIVAKNLQREQIKVTDYGLSQNYCDAYNDWGKRRMVVPMDNADLVFNFLKKEYREEKEIILTEEKRRFGRKKKIGTASVKFYCEFINKDLIKNMMLKVSNLAKQDNINIKYYFEIGYTLNGNNDEKKEDIARVDLDNMLITTRTYSDIIKKGKVIEEEFYRRIRRISLKDDISLVVEYSVIF